MPAFRFTHSVDGTPVTPGSPLWQAPLPTSRATAAGWSPARDADAPALTCGAYFSALHQALSRDHCAPLREAVRALTGAPEASARIDHVEIRLLKHGHFYHPAWVAVKADGRRHQLALNVALTPDGIDLLPQETAALKTLAAQGDDLGLPQVLVEGACRPADGPDPVLPAQVGQWFLCPWFDGFHEFHLTRAPSGPLVVAVWDGSVSPHRLDATQTADLLTAAAARLATAVDPHTLAHIFPWHHAAGDFVVRLDSAGSPEVRLITARDYQPLLPPPESEIDPDTAIERLLYALLLLVIQAALRLRVDRLDGVGEIVLYPTTMVAPICRGLLTGLIRMRRRWRLPAQLDAVVTDYLRTPSLAELSALNQELQGGFAPGSPERRTCAAILEPHVEALYHELQTG
ncbi:MAG: hypothetical protein QNJ22_14070 [Desulfosarcinaceae bacterium]|nr:hypothetical protein [Desulfosarcinaceae bacterium]